MAKTSLDVLAVYKDRHSYYLTCKAENRETARAEIIRLWGDALYRRFRLFLWGSAYAFLNAGIETSGWCWKNPAKAEPSKHPAILDMRIDVSA